MDDVARLSAGDRVHVQGPKRQDHQDRKLVCRVFRSQGNAA